MSYTPPTGSTGLSIAFVGGYAPPSGSTALPMDLAGTSAAAGATITADVTLAGVVSLATAALGAAPRTVSGSAILSVASSAATRVRVALAGAATSLFTSVAEAIHTPANASAAATLGHVVTAGGVVTEALSAPNLPTVMNPLKFNLVIDQGATFERTLLWKAGTPAGPVIFTGCSARAQIRQNIEDPTPVLELTTANGRLTLGDADGKLTITIAAQDTAALSEVGGVYDLELVYPDGRVRRLMQGLVVVRPEVTR